jgi:hypothetical protein
MDFCIAFLIVGVDLGVVREDIPTLLELQKMPVDQCFEIEAVSPTTEGLAQPKTRPSRSLNVAFTTFSPLHAGLTRDLVQESFRGGEASPLFAAPPFLEPALKSIRYWPTATCPYQFSSAEV